MIVLINKFRIKTPIIQAPMAGISTPALAAAVSNAGALGSLGVGPMNAEAARSAIKQTKKLTQRPFNINVCVGSMLICDSKTRILLLRVLTGKSLFEAFLHHLGRGFGVNLGRLNF